MAMTQKQHLEMAALLDAIVEAIELDESFDLNAHTALTVSLESLKAAREHHKASAGEHPEDAQLRRRYSGTTASRDPK